MRTENSPVNVSGLKLEAPVMVGAGPIKLPEHVLEIAKSHAAAIIVGSITIEPRAGNEGTTYFADPNRHFALNSKGLPNPGLHIYREMLPVMTQIAHDHGKPLIVNIAGFSPKEYKRLAGTVVELGADGVELNLGCPNVWGKDGQQKQIASFSEDITGETLRSVQEELGRSDTWVDVKLSPYSDPSKLRSIADIIARSQMVRAVTSINTFPNALALDETGEAVIDPGDGLAGLSGEAMKSVSLGQVKQLRGILPDAIAVIGVGGISNAQDVRDYLQAGASATQITTAYINFGPGIFATARGLQPES